MANSTLIRDYLGQDVFANRPVTPPVGSHILAVFFATDTGALYLWNGSSWVAGNFVNPMTAQDDLIVGAAGGAPGRLAKGANGTILMIDPVSGHVTWEGQAIGDAGLVSAASMFL